MLSINFDTKDSIAFYIEKLIRFFLFIFASISVVITIFVVVTIFYESFKFFSMVPIGDFLFGTNWYPQAGDAENNVFGAIPVFSGTLLITSIAIIVACPLGILSAVYLTEYANKKTRLTLKPIIEILAGVPTVVYGYFAVITVSPFIRDVASMLGLEVTSENALAAGLVMGIMIIPFILSLSDDIINSIPQTLRDASLALGATTAETTIKVVLPAAFPGIMSAILLAISRAIGETMIVTMATGFNANFTFNPLSSVTTVTAQIVALLLGDQEFDSPKTLSAYALALVLFVITLSLNMVSAYIIGRYKKKYA
jgi:phosphate transport system permease protein